MKERLYQGTIGSLLIVASFAFYNLYKKEDISKEKEKLAFDLSKSIDIKALKQNYQNIVHFQHSVTVSTRLQQNKQY